MRRFRIGIAGAGMIAETAHIPATLNCSDAELCAIIEKNAARGSLIRTNFNLEIPVVSNLNEIIDTIDGLIICTPNDLHKELTLNALDHGLHVLVEKPLATSYQDGYEMVQKSKVNDRTLTVGFCTRFWPSVRYVKDLISNKSLGKVNRFVFQYGSSGGWSPVSNYIKSKKNIGGGAFIINGSHYLDRMIWYFGTPQSFTFKDDSAGGSEANALAEFFYDNNFGKFKGIIRVSKTVNLTPGLVIEFENGILTHRDWGSPTINLKMNGQGNFGELVGNSEIFNHSTRPDMYLLQLEEFIANSFNRTITPVSDLNDALECVKITEELYRIRENMNCHWYNIGQNNE